MAEICCGESQGLECETTSSRLARRRRMEIRRFKFGEDISAISNPTTTDTDTNTSINSNNNNSTGDTKRPKMDISTATTTATTSAAATAAGVASSSSSYPSPFPREYEFDRDEDSKLKDVMMDNTVELSCSGLNEGKLCDYVPRFGVASVCGRRRDMEDAVAVHPCFFRSVHENASEFHYFGVYDGHGCSHVASKCKERLHGLVKEELVAKETTTALSEWEDVMEQSFGKMDKEVVGPNEGVVGSCRCELQTPECDAVGSTAVVAVVTPDKIIVANCGDSRAVLCRNGKALPLSSDHKPDQPDELNRIQDAGGRVIYWDGARVLGVLAMSRAIGDNYLKPYVCCDPEVTITVRTTDDDCLILASDGLWDVVSNDTACGVARMCLRGKAPSSPGTEENEGSSGDGDGMADKACADASMLLTKLALARHSADNVSVVVVNLS